MTSLNFNVLYNAKITRRMIRKLKSDEYRIYSLSVNPKTNKRSNLGTFETLNEAKNHERQIAYFKHNK